MKLDDAAIAEISLMLKALSEPLRLRIMNLLHESEHSVGELVEALVASQANVSKHLKILNSVSLVKSRRDGNTIYYSLYDTCINDLCAAICSGYSKIFQKKYSHQLKLVKRTKR